MGRLRLPLLLCILVLVAPAGPGLPPAAVAAAPLSDPPPPEVQVDFTAVADAALLEWAPMSNFGSAATLQVTYAGPVLPMSAWTLVRFGLGGLPAGAVIDSAQLELWQESPAQAPWVTIAAHLALTDWLEENVTWSSRPVPQGYAEASLALDDSTGWKGWNLTIPVRGWLNAPDTNRGVVLVGPGDGDAYNRFFTSREGTQRPRLRVS
jgi:hypothetical protein